jgi:hypothetical protein
MSEKIILGESRITDFEKNFGRKFTQDQKEKIIGEIPSKFYGWIGRVLDQVSFDTNFEMIKNLLDYFNKFGSNLKRTDIFQYQDVNDLKTELDKYALRQRRNVKKVNGANVVYESPRYMVVNPLSHESSCYYGQGTKWCTSGRDASETFNRYNTDGKLFYIIDKTLPTSDPNYKIGLSKKFNGDESYYDATDKSIYTSTLFQQPEFKIISEKIKNYLSTEYSEQVKVEEEKLQKKKEAERLRKIEIQRILNAKMSEADDRRVEQEWALTNDIDEEGKMAWAVLNYLENEGATVRDREQEERLLEINTEIDRLNLEYEQDDEVRSDILDQINELEEERDEILEMIDVYYIIPETYEHYGLAKFEVIHPDFNGQTFAVGNEDEVEEAMREYVDSLIDDIGITGFNESFWRNHIDEDAVAEHSRDNYEYDVYENPDSYFDDDERMLDKKQVDQIKFNKQKMAKLEITIEQLEAYQSELDEDSEEYDNIEEKIDSLRDSITELDEEIVEIEENPEGDFPEDLINDKIDDLVDEVRKNPQYYMDEYGLNAEDFVDKDEFIQAVIDADGYGQLSSYDGSYEIFRVMGEQYYVFRID